MPAPAPLRFDPAREEAELRAYLGGEFDVTALRHAWPALEAELAAAGDEATLYRTSQAYLYDLTAFAMTGTKLPYLDTVTELVAPGARILDFGCGIGSDGLLLLEAGYRVEFADFANPSTAYLRWRLERRGLSAPIHDLDAGVPGGFDAAYAFDVVEHVPDALALLGQLEERAELVVVNLLEFEPHEQALHHPLPVRALVRRAASFELERYRVLHGSSHLVAYRPRRAGARRRAVSAGRVAAERLRRRAGRRAAP